MFELILLELSFAGNVQVITGFIVSIVNVTLSESVFPNVSLA